MKLVKNWLNIKVKWVKNWLTIKMKWAKKLAEHKDEMVKQKGHGGPGVAHLGFPDCVL